MIRSQMQKPEPEMKTTNPLIILMGILVLAMLMTYFVESGNYQRDGRIVVPNSFQTLEKDTSLSNLLEIAPEASLQKASPVSIVGMLLAIPEGLERGSALIFMVLIIGGLFGILTKSGAIDAGLERMMGLVRGNIYLLIIFLMLLFSAGSTFLGLASEYLLVIPLMVAMAKRIGIPHIIGFAIVCVSVKAGYLSSVTNPMPLTIAQPLLGLPIFSGAGMRFAFYLVFITIGIAFVLWTVKKAGCAAKQDIQFKSSKLSNQHFSMLMVLILSIAFLVYASNSWHWNKQELSAYYIAVSVVLAVISGLGANGAADAFVSGMKKVLLASFLIGIATAVAVTLEKGKILDTVVYNLMSIVGEDNPHLSAAGMFASQLLLDFLIPSTSGQAAVSMPILGPIGQLSGVSEQTTVVAFLFGNGITNIITPTSGTLLAYLATARVGWLAWAKYVAPLWLAYIIIAIILLMISVQVGF